MEYYAYVFIFHIMSFISWMAALFYLPRLFVYHVEHFEKKEFVEIVQIQEYKLYKYIGTPAMWATIVSGLCMLVLHPMLLETGIWLYAKLFVVALLIAYDYSMNVYRLQLLEGRCTKSGKFFRAYNEFPTLLAILIVTYVILKDVPVIFTLFMVCLFAFIVYFLFKHARPPKMDITN